MKLENNKSSLKGNKPKIVFIVLQYNHPEETIDCVESILKNSKEYFKVVIVDNGSIKENYEKIIKRYEKNKDIDIIKTNKNLGFSRGNNFGFEYVKKKYDPFYYYIISNDTLLTQNDYLRYIEEEYKKSKFDVLGADIIELDGKHVSPIKGNLGIPKWKLFPRFYLIYLVQMVNLYPFLYKLKKKITKKQFSKLDHTQRKENVAFQGSALLFSKKCFEKLPKPFYPETFLYSEEDILNYNRVRYGLKFVYTPKIKIIHKESVTIDKLKKTKIGVLNFKLKHNLKSLNIFYDYMKNTKDKIQKD